MSSNGHYTAEELALGLTDSARVAPGSKLAAA